MTTESSFYGKNLFVLQKYHPHLVQLIVDANCETNITVRTSNSAHPVPVVDGTPIHSLDNPMVEGESLAAHITNGLTQEKILLFGFGFGYHIIPLIRKGYSPIVVEPSLSTFKLALMHVDLTRIIPFSTFYFGSLIPDIPRGTKLFGLDVTMSLFPSDAQRLSAKVISEMPAKTDDIEEGVYYATYRNVSCLKNPIDLAIYQMLIFLVPPTLILEIGTCRGGSALYFADLLQTLRGTGHVHTFDIVDEAAPEVYGHPLITFHPGGWQSFDPAIVGKDDRVLVIEDSAHTYENTIQVLRAFADYVTPNSYFIVEDGGAGLVRPDLNGGALRAVEEFLQDDTRFEVDYHWENFFGTGNSECLKGFLRRKP